MSQYTTEELHRMHWHNKKTYRPDYGVWVRQTDCLIAEKVMNFRWVKCPEKRDFCGYKFAWILNPPQQELDGKYILEPDTRVPNYTTHIDYAIEVARQMGWDSIPLLESNKEVSEWVCRKAISELGA